MRTWFSAHGTEWEAESYEEALEQERDALVEQLETAQRRADDQAEKFQRETLLSNRLATVANAARLYQLARAGGIPQDEQEAWRNLDAAIVDSLPVDEQQENAAWWISPDGKRRLWAVQPHQGDYEPPEVDDWRPGDHR